MAIVVFVGCDGTQPSADQQTDNRAAGQPIRIVTTCGMVTDIVRHVAGDRGDVIGLMSEGVDPHLYKPTRDDVKKLMDAELIFYSGLMLEGRMATTLDKVAERGQAVFAVTAGVDRDMLREPPGFEGHQDPHVWMNVSAWSDCVTFVASSLAEFDPDNAQLYTANAAKYQKQLKELHEYVTSVIASIPKEQRILITAHDAFGYFSEAYDIEVLSPQGLTTESEAGVDDINRLVDTIVERKIQAIFVESSVPKDNIRAIIEGTASRGWSVKIGGELFSDAMGEPGTYEGTYIGMLDHNATTICRALGGEAPERGMNGKLSSSGDE